SPTRYRHNPPLSPCSGLPNWRGSLAGRTRSRRKRTIDSWAGGLSFWICFSAVRPISIRQVLLGEAKPPLQFFERDGGLAALQRRNALQVVFAVFQVLPNGLARIIALAAACFFRERLQLFFEFGFKPDPKHSRLECCLTCLT